MDVLPGRVKELLFRRNVLISIIVTNLAGTVFGFYYYAELLLDSPVKLWIFIPDSPLATLAIALSLALYMKGRQNSFLDMLAFIGNLKYGLWTPFILLYMREGFLYGISTPMYLFLLISHFLMAVQALMVLEYSNFSSEHVLSSGLWFLLNDLVDYSYGVHAELPTISGLTDPPAFAAYTLTLSSLAILYAALTKKDGEQDFLILVGG